MQKALYVIVAILAIGAIYGFKHYKNMHPELPPQIVADDPHPDEGRPVNITIGAHHFVIPRYYIANYPGENANLQNASAGEGKYQISRLAELDLIASLPDMKPVAAADRSDPYGGHVDTIVRIAIVNNQPDSPKTLKQVEADLQTKGMGYSVAKGPYGLTQEDDATLAGKIPGHHMFGMLYGRELMMTCQQAPGLRCSFDYPLGDQTVTASFSTAQLANWAAIYPKVVQYVTAFRKS